ncbi:hypothetical protein EIP91_007224 [Steccherinum ochraceum]|uniref:Uncharacterized protein n=1 Tax=Steccherinum ochraceum TaxID=92696 RepID=A0A4R0RCT2_9APHY|nr:hypothetical protein EIP91_007224 [Steccherinum ochraceum]
MIYAHLLRAEILELAKDKATSWDRIMEIRHLKDRMIRKCQRLARGASIRDKNTSRVMFFTVHAPPDFRMKEMERWFRSQGPEITQTEETYTRSTPYCCEKCGPLLPQQPRPPPSKPAQPPKRSSSQRSTHTKAGISERIARRPSGSQLAATASRQARQETTSPPPLPVPVRSRSISRNPTAPRQQSHSRTPPYVPTPERSRQASPAHGIRSEHPPRASLQSPDPVPIPYRSPRPVEVEDVDEDDGLEIPIVDRSPSPMQELNVEPPSRSSDDDLYADPLPPTPPIARTPDPNQVSFPPLETIHEAEDSVLGLPRPNLPRRRSSLKKSGSMSRLSMISQSKSVTWAMDKDWVDQMTQFVEVTKDAELVGKELENERAHYHQNVHEMREVARDVAAAAEKMRHETQSFQREETALRDQEHRLLEALQRMEAKETEYHQKVITVLEETKRVVQLCDKKRDRHE